MFFVDHREEEEEEDEDAQIDDALLGELDDDTLIDEEADPILKSAALDPLVPGEETPEGIKIFEDDGEDDEEDLEYDSFDDRDEL